MSRQLEENNIDISVFYDPSTDLPQMIDRSTLAEKVLMQKFPHEIAHVLTRIGRPYVPTDAMLQSQGDIMLQLKDRSEWTDAKDQKELTAKITKVMNELPGFSTDYTQPIQMRMYEMIYGQGQTSDFGVKVFGPDLAEIRAQAAKDRRRDPNGQRRAGCQGADDDRPAPACDSINRHAIARDGIYIADVNSVIDSAIGSRTATMVVDGNEQVEVTVRLASDARQTPEQIGRVLVPGPNGLQVPLSALATIRDIDGPVQIDRENQKRRIMVNANVGGSDLGGFVKSAEQKIKSQVHLPSGYTLAYGGEYESLQQGRARLAMVVPIALVAILALLLVVFGRMRQALIIFTGIPLAVSGGIIALHAAGAAVFHDRRGRLYRTRRDCAAQRHCHAVVYQQPAHAGEIGQRCRRAGSARASAPRPDDRHGRDNRLYPHGDLDRHGSGSAASTGDSGYRRPDHVHPADAVCPADALFLV